MNVNEDVKTEPLNEQGDSAHHEQQLYSSSNQIPSTKSRVPNASPQVDEMIVKIEIDDIANIIENKSIPATQSQTSNQQNNGILDSNRGHFNCSKYSTDFCVKKEEENDQEIVTENVHSGVIENLNESDDSDSRPAKQPRLDDDWMQDGIQEESDDDCLENLDDCDNSNPKRTKASQIENDQARSSNQTKQKLLTTISLKCHKCAQMCKNTKALNAHLKSVHSTEQYRCLYKDCNRSFDKLIHFTHHHGTSHPSQANIMWPCDYCSSYFKNHNSLQNHFWMDHQEGLFQCSHSDCRFMSKLRRTMYIHSNTNHKSLLCQHPGCKTRFANACDLKIHERIHGDAKPYRCKWPQCEYVSSRKKSVITHIRRHLKRAVKSKQKPSTKISYDPNHYLEIVNELL